MTTQNLFSNRATAKLAVAVSAGDTALTLVAGGGAWFPTPAANQFFRLVIQKGSAQTDQREYMLCTGKTGDVLTVTRGLEGTPAAAFAADDEVSLVATALTMGSFVQRVGGTLQGALEVEAPPVANLGIANKQYVDDVSIDDAPADGKDYARKDTAWHALGAAASLPVPIPVGMGGTGGISVSEAQANLAIAKTTFDDVAPTIGVKYGDRWIRPSSMTEMVWVPNAGGAGAGVWINPADAASEAYPISIAKGGTGATTSGQALINLGIAAHDSIAVSINASDLYTTLRAKAVGANSIFQLQKSGAGSNVIYGYGGASFATGNVRWGVFLGNSEAESGSNAGSNFVLYRYDDAGTALGAALSINRATGATTFGGPVSLGNGINVSAGAGLFPDGTVAAPGIAYSNEPGLGFYRVAPGMIRMATGGAGAMQFDMNAAGGTYLYLFPRAAGQSQVLVSDQPLVSANYHRMFLGSATSGYSIAESLGGSAAAQPLYMTFPAGVNVSHTLVTGGVIQATNGIGVGTTGTNNATLTLNKISANSASDVYGMYNNLGRWLLRLGAGGVDDFTIDRYTDAGAHNGTVMTLVRSTGQMQLNASPGGLGIYGTNGLNVPNGPISAGGAMTSGSVVTGPVNCTTIGATGTIYAASTIGCGGMMTSGGVNTSPLTCTTINASGNIVGNTVSSGGGRVSMFTDNAQANYLGMQSAATAWSWQWYWPNGALSWLNGSSTNVWSVDGAGTTSQKGDFAATGKTVRSAYIETTSNITAGGVFVSNGAQLILGTQGSNFTNNGIYWVGNDASTSGTLRFNQITANPAGMAQWLSFQHNPGNYAFAQLQVGATSRFQFNNNNDAYKDGAPNTWSIPSDSRIKRNVVDYKGGLEQIVALRPVAYQTIPYKDDEFNYSGDPVYIGLISDEAEIPMPELVKRGHGVLRDGTEVEDFAVMNIDPMLFAMVNAIKTLHQRLQQLETLQ